MQTKQSHRITSALWHRDLNGLASFDRLQSTHHTEVLVVGAGITGLTTAIELAERGRKVTVCEAESIGAGTTAASSGHLDALPEVGPKAFIDRWGIKNATHFTRLRRAAIDRIESLASADCDFRRTPAYQYSGSADDVDRLKQEFAAAQQLGLSAAWQPEVPFQEGACGFRVDAMARINTGCYLKRLVELACDAGVTIFEQTLVESPSASEPHCLAAGEGSVRFDHVVYAVHCNFTGSMKLYAATPPYQSYLLAARTKQSLEDALFWDNSEPYYYIRRLQSDDSHLVLVGGCDHRTGTANEIEQHQHLEAWLRDRFDVEEVVLRWSAELFEPVDGLPMIGLAPGKQNVLIATGLSGVGLTWGTAAASILADIIVGSEDRFAKHLSPSRSGLSNVSQWLKEQATTTSNYLEHLLPADRICPEEIAAGQGKTGKLDGKHVAYCRDQEGCEHRLDPVCPHKGGVLHWNATEQTWDCSVHGGRFAADGQRIYGPPESNMSPSK